MAQGKSKATVAGELIPVAPEASSVPAVVNPAWAEEWQEAMEHGGFDLPRIEIVREIQQFKIPPENVVKEFRGIYLGEVRFNIKFPKTDPGVEEKTPPECVARDAVTGSHNAKTIDWTDPESGEVRPVQVYGKCAKCFYNQFGSKDGGGKACASRSSLMVWPVGVDAVLPYIINLPVTSLTWKVRSAPLGISHAGAAICQMVPVYKAPPTAILSRFWLEKQTKGQNVWSILQATVLGTVEVEEYRRCSEFAKKYMPWLTERAADLDDDIQDAEVLPVNGQPSANDDPGHESTARRDRFEEAKTRAGAVTTGNPPY